MAATTTKWKMLGYFFALMGVLELMQVAYGFFGPHPDYARCGMWAAFCAAFLGLAGAMFARAAKERAGG